MLAMSYACALNNRACRCDPSAADQKFRPCALARRIGALVRLQGSPLENEAFGAAAGLRRLVAGEGLDFNDIATLIENCNGAIETLKYSDGDAERIYARGIENGREQCSGRSLSVDFFDDDGEPRWVEIAKFCQSNQTGLNPKEQEFIDEMPSKLRWRMPSAGQGGFLLSIFWKTRGSLR
jgi:hypothetical protein